MFANLNIKGETFRVNIPEFEISLVSVESHFDDILPLIKSHFQEVSYYSKSFPLNVNKEMYLGLDKTDSMRLFVVKSKGKCIGYSSYYLMRHPHVNILQAHQDAIYLSPDYRKHGIGKMLIQFADNLFKQLGVSVVFNSVTTKVDFSEMLLSMGYERAEQLYARKL